MQCHKEDPGPTAALHACAELAGICSKALAAQPPPDSSVSNTDPFSRLRSSLRAMGELFPFRTPGMPGLDEAAAAPTASDVGDADNDGLHSSVAAQSPFAQQHGAVAPSQAQPPGVTKHAAGSISVCDCLKAGQLWLHRLAQQPQALEAACKQPWPNRAAGQGRAEAAANGQVAPSSAGTTLGSEGDSGAVLQQHVVQRLQESGHAAAAALLLQSLGRTADALEAWVGAFGAAASGSRARVSSSAGAAVANGGDAVPLSECATLAEHFEACAAQDGAQQQEQHAHPSTPYLRAEQAAAALTAAVHGAELLCDPAVLPELTGAHQAWAARLPSQCLLALMHARSDTNAEQLLAAHATHTRQMTMNGSGQANGSTALTEHGASNAALWLQVRWQHHLSQRRPNDASAHLALLQLLLQLIAANEAQASSLRSLQAEPSADAVMAVHHAYGPQHAQCAAASDCKLLTPQRVRWLAHSGASAAVQQLASLLVPLSCSSLPQHADKQAQTSLSAQAWQGVPPLCSLFLQCLAAAPSSCARELQHVLPQLLPLHAGQNCSVRQLHAAVHEACGGAGALHSALRVLLADGDSSPHSVSNAASARDSTDATCNADARAIEAGMQLVQRAAGRCTPGGSDGLVPALLDTLTELAPPMGKALLYLHLKACPELDRQASYSGSDTGGSTATNGTAQSVASKAQSKVASERLWATLLASQQAAAAGQRHDRHAAAAAEAVQCVLRWQEADCDLGRIERCILCSRCGLSVGKYDMLVCRASAFAYTPPLPPFYTPDESSGKGRLPGTGRKG